MTEILPRLFLGGIRDVTSLKFLADHHITGILSCCNAADYDKAPPGIDQYRINVEDMSTEPILDHLGGAVVFIEKHRNIRGLDFPHTHPLKPAATTTSSASDGHGGTASANDIPADNNSTRKTGGSSLSPLEAVSEPPADAGVGIDWKSSNLSVLQVTRSNDIHRESHQDVSLANCGILVHCRSGVSRSATICVGYLMIQWHLSLHDAFNLVIRRRSCVCPNIGFMTQLVELEKKMVEQSSIGFTTFQDIGNEIGLDSEDNLEDSSAPPRYFALLPPDDILLEQEETAEGFPVRSLPRDETNNGDRMNDGPEANQTNGQLPYSTAGVTMSVDSQRHEAASSCRVEVASPSSPSIPPVPSECAALQEVTTAQAAIARGATANNSSNSARSSLSTAASLRDRLRQIGMALIRENYSPSHLDGYAPVTSIEEVSAQAAGLAAATESRDTQVNPTEWRNAPGFGVDRGTFSSCRSIGTGPVAIPVSNYYAVQVAVAAAMPLRLDNGSYCAVTEGGADSGRSHKSTAAPSTANECNAHQATSCAYCSSRENPNVRLNGATVQQQPTWRAPVMARPPSSWGIPFGSYDCGLVPSSIDLPSVTHQPLVHLSSAVQPARPFAPSYTQHAIALRENDGPLPPVGGTTTASDCPHTIERTLGRSCGLSSGADLSQSVDISPSSSTYSPSVCMISYINWYTAPHGPRRPRIPQLSPR